MVTARRVVGVLAGAFVAVIVTGNAALAQTSIDPTVLPQRNPPPPLDPPPPKLNPPPRKLNPPSRKPNPPPRKPNPPPRKPNPPPQPRRQPQRRLPTSIVRRCRSIRRPSTRRSRSSSRR